jgi:two-component system response regulator HydG
MKPRLLLVDDNPQSLESTRRILEHEGYFVETEGDGQAALDRLQRCLTPSGRVSGVLAREGQSREGFDLVISDVRMPKMSGLELFKALQVCRIQVPVILMTAFGQIDEAVWALKHGAIDFLTKPFKRQELIQAVRRGLLQRQEEQLEGGPFSLGRGEITPRLIGRSQRIQRLNEEIAKVAPTEVNLVLAGESGSGKELAARAIHAQSGRKEKPWVAVNCAALPETLMESEFFGFERGAFTGATAAKAGLFEAAHGGTLFLDEIAELPLPLQAKLLRVLQDQKVQRLGAHLPRQVDVRVIAASNRNLRDCVAQGTFRQDLLYRLEVVQIEVPSLRDRLSDLPELVSYFLSMYSQKHQRLVRGVAPEVLALFEAYGWPGNVRELSHALERSVIFAKDEVLRLEDLPGHLSSFSLATSVGEVDSQRPSQQLTGSIEIPLGTPLKDVEDLLIRKTLEATSGDKNMTARLLGMSSRTIYRKLNPESST